MYFQTKHWYYLYIIMLSGEMRALEATLALLKIVVYWTREVIAAFLWLSVLRDLFTGKAY